MKNSKKFHFGAEERVYNDNQFYYDENLEYQSFYPNSASIKIFIDELIEVATHKISPAKVQNAKELLMQPNVPGRYEFEQNKQKLRRKLFYIFNKNNGLLDFFDNKYLYTDEKKYIIKSVSEELEKYYNFFNEGVYTGKTMPEEEVKNGLNTLENKILSIGKKNSKTPKTIKQAEKERGQRRRREEIKNNYLNRVKKDTNLSIINEKEEELYSSEASFVENSNAERKREEKNKIRK